MGDRNAVARKRARLVLNVFVVMFAVAVFSIGAFQFSNMRENAKQARQNGRAKNILTGMALYAADKGAGVYPFGSYDPETEEFSDLKDELTAEECFQDLFDSGVLDLESLFWHPGHEKQCNEEEPNEDGKLEPGENSWDYIAIMNNSVGNLPLIFTASDSGKAKTWTKAGGHPWRGALIVGMADGSSVMKETLNRHGRCLTPRRSSPTADHCVPLPGIDGWPELARIAPATPVR